MPAPITDSDAEPTMLAKVYLLGQLRASQRRAGIAVPRDRVAADADRLAALTEGLDATEVPDGAQEVH